MANHQGFNPGPNQTGMNRMMNYRMPPPNNQIRQPFSQGYPTNPSVAPYIPHQQYIQAQVQHPQQIFYAANGVRNPAPMPHSFVQTPGGGYNQFAQTAASLQAAQGGQGQPPQQNIYSQQPLFAHSQLAAASYAARGGQYQPMVYQVPPHGMVQQHQGAFMSGGMPPHSGQPTPGLNPAAPSLQQHPGAPSLQQHPGNPHLQQQQQQQAQQQGKSPYQQVQIPSSVPPPSSTPSHIQTTPHTTISSNISVSAASFQPQQQQLMQAQHIPVQQQQPGPQQPPQQQMQPPQQPQQQQIAVTQPPPLLAKREKKILQFINPNTGRSIFKNGVASSGPPSTGAPAGAGGPPPGAGGPPPGAGGPLPGAGGPPPQTKEMSVDNTTEEKKSELKKDDSIHSHPPPPTATTIPQHPPPNMAASGGHHPPPNAGGGHIPPPSAMAAAMHQHQQQKLPVMHPPPSVIPTTDVKEATPPPTAAVPARGSGDLAANMQQAPKVASYPQDRGQDKEMLSVAVESKRDDNMYEPVSPTPLPDSPVEETKAVTSGGSASVQQPSKPHEKIPVQQEEDMAKSGKKKKLTPTQRRVELNKKGEEKERKGADLLEVFKHNTDSQPEPATNKQSTPAAVFKEPSPPAPVAAKELTPPAAVAVKEPSPAPSAVRQATPLLEGSGKQGDTEHMNHRSEPVKMNGVSSSDGPEKMDVDKASTPSNHIAEIIELEEGEIIEDEDETAGNGAELKLKYNYRKEQWSPLNPEGKKQYEREFLIQLQFDDMSQIKPLNLPDMEIIKDKPMRRDISRASYNFEPSYIKSSVSQGRHHGPGGHGGHGAGLGKRPSKSKEPKRLLIPSFSQNVELRKAEKGKAWAPNVQKKSAEPESEDDIEELKKKVRAILNKLTPQKFETLVAKFQDLPIVTKVKLEESMELVFEKAVDEPAFSVAYAQMCHVLSQREIKEGEQTLKFRTILIRRVQKEFDKDYMKDVDASLKAKAEDKSLSDAERKSAREEYSTQEMKARRRSLGNIRFIGELYNLQLLTLNIMHDCVTKLISKTDEESLEGLCRLVTTVGLQFDKETCHVIQTIKAGGINKETANKKYPSVKPISYYFDKMQGVIEMKATSSRVRFLMQDVIDLKKASWKKRREEAGPKKIDQIHADMKKEQLSAELNNMSSHSMPRQRDSMGPPSGGDARKRSQRGGNQQTDDGWTVTARPMRNTLDKVDTNKIKNIGRNPTDVDTISLAPKSGGWGSWGKGASSSRSSSTRQEPEINTGNRFGAFQSSESSSNAPYEGRQSGGGYEGRSSTGYGGRPSYGAGSGGGRPGSYVGRGSRGQSVEQDKARQEVIQAVRHQMHPGGNARSASTIMSSDSDRSRTSAPKSASMRVPSKSRDDTKSGLKGNENEDPDILDTLSVSRVNEFLSTKDYKEAHQSIREKFHPKTVHLFIINTLNNLLERRVEERKPVGLLYSSLLKEGIITEAKFIIGVSDILEIGSDLEIDIPKFWDTLASLLVAPVMDGFLSLGALCEASQAKEQVAKFRAKFLAALLHAMRAESESRVGGVWSKAAINLKTFLTDKEGKQDVDAFFRDNKLEFLVDSAPGAAAPSSLSAANQSSSAAVDVPGFCKELQERLKADTSNILNFVTDRVKDRHNPDFVRGLVTTLAEACIDGLGGPVEAIKLNEEKFSNLCMDILTELEFTTEQEIQCILTIQLLSTKLEHPVGLFMGLLNQLYQSDVVKYPATKAWKDDNQADNQSGKGVCVAASSHLLVEIAEGEDADNDEEDAA